MEFVPLLPPTTKRMIRLIWIFCFTFLTSLHLDAQSINSLPEAELELEKLLISLREAENNSEKKERNDLFKTKLVEVLNQESSMNYNFTKLTTVGFIPSPDQMVRIVNWNVEQDDQSQKYYCFIQRIDPKKNEYQLHEMTKSLDVMAMRPTDILQSNQWYGALYYQIIPFEKGNRDMYIVLGWDGLGTTSNMKLIDVLYFSGNQAKLGSPVFKVGNETFKRVFYEHSEKTTMSLRFDPKYGRILFDHLSPESPNLIGHYSYYVPDLSYDAFIFKSGKWYLQEDVIAVNAESIEKQEIIVPDEDGNLQKTKIKNRWINPSDKEAPAGGNNHEAALPEGEPVKETKEEAPKTKKKWFEKKDKRDPSNQYPYKDWKPIKTKKKKKSQ
jgi:hypothetical protein